MSKSKIKYLGFTRHDPFTWFVFNQSTKPVEGYVIYIAKAYASPSTNYQLVIAKCMRDNKRKRTCNLDLLAETFSFHYYASGDAYACCMLQEVVNTIKELINEIDLANPVHLALYYGGEANHAKVMLPSINYELQGDLFQ